MILSVFLFSKFCLFFYATGAIEMKEDNYEIPKN